MKTKGVYYRSYFDKIILITKVEYYEDIFNEPFSIVTWIDERGIFPNTSIAKSQFKYFKRIGSYDPQR